MKSNDVNRENSTSSCTKKELGASRYSPYKSSFKKKMKISPCKNRDNVSSLDYHILFLVSQLFHTQKHILIMPFFLPPGIIFSTRRLDVVLQRSFMAALCQWTEMPYKKKILVFDGKKLALMSQNYCQQRTWD